MSWLKRNLFFVVGSVIALGMIGFAGFLLYSKTQENVQVTENMQGKITDLKRLYDKSPYPSKENIDAAKAELKKVEGLLEQAKQVFSPPPKVEPLSDAEFKDLLRKTIGQLQERATNSGVEMPLGYDFTFNVQNRKLFSFHRESKEAWVVQLREIQAICDLIFGGKVIELTALRRVRVAEEDAQGSEGDYLNASSTTNALTISTPYQVTFRAFSGQLADVMNRFLQTTNPFVIKSVSVENGKGGGVSQGGGAAPMEEVQQPRQRFGLPGAAPGGLPFPGAPAAPRPGGAPGAALGSGPMTKILDESPLQVTFVIEVIRLNEASTSGGKRSSSR